MHYALYAAILKRPLKITMSENVIGQLESRLRNELDIVWEIPNFLSLSAEVGKRYESPVSFFGDTSWYLRVYPNGTKWVPSKGSVVVYVCRGDAGPPVTATFDLFLKRTEGKSRVGSEEKYTFVQKGDMRGYFSALKRSDMIDRPSAFLSSGTLTVNCCLKFDEQRKVAVNEAFTQTDAYPADPIPVKEPSELASTQAQLECYTDKLSRDLSELLLSGEDSDLTVKVKDVEFRLHRLIMGARTPVFSAMLRHDMREKATGLVSIDDCKPEVFRAFVRYVYSGRVDNLSTETVFQLFAMADKYQLEELKSACFEFTQSTLSVDTFCDVVCLALTYDQRQLLKLATEYFAHNMTDILRTVKWMKFLKDHHIQANELMLKSVSIITSKR